MADQIGDYTLEDVVNKDIFELIGAEEFSDEEKSSLVNKMMATVFANTMDRFDQTLDGGEKIKFKEILDSQDEQKLQDFYTGKNFNVEEVMAEEALKYKIKMVTYVSFIKKSASTVAELKNKILSGELDG